jgi:hypothetical protein
LGWKEYIVLKLLCSKLIFLAICLSANVLLAKPIPVRNVKVDVKGKTALEARDTAMDQARQRAFVKLAAEYPEFGINTNAGVPPDNVLESLVIDYEVVREKMSAVRYIGVFNFNFNDRALRRYLAGSGKLVKPKPGVMTAKDDRETDGGQRFLIIPIYISPDTSYLWEEDNPWALYWTNQETKTKGKISGYQFTVPLGDLRDISGLTIEDALTSKDRPLSLIMERYKGTIALTVVLKSLDDGLNSHELQIRTHTSSGAFEPIYEPIVLQGQKGVSLDDIFKNAMQKSFAIVTGKGNLNMTEAVEPSQRDDDTQTSQESDSDLPSNFNAIASFNNFQEWQAIRQALGRSDYVDDFDIINLNRQQAEIYLRSRVPVSTLKGKLAQVGLKLDYSSGKARLSLSNKPERSEKPARSERSERPERSEIAEEPVRHKVPSPFTPSAPPPREEEVEVIEEEDQESESFQPEVIE